MGLRRNATGGFVFDNAVHSKAELKDLMTQAPMSAEQYATLMKKRNESRRKLEDQLELKRSRTDNYS